MDNTKTLVLGSQGMVGSALGRRLLSRVFDSVLDAGKASWDLTDPLLTYGNILKMKPDVIFLSAYMPNVDACQDRSTDTMNMDACINIAAAADEIEAKIVFISSSYVFDGNSATPYIEDDEPHPINHYGAQKLAVEDYIRLVCRKYVIARTVGLFGPDQKMKSFPHQIIRAAQGGQKILAPKDQWMTPCHTDMFADILVRVSLNTDFNGTFHLSGDKSVTKAEFAADIAAMAGVDAEIIPIDSDVVKQIAKRPKMGSLDSSFITSLLPDVQVPSYTASLRRFMDG